MRLPVPSFIGRQVGKATSALAIIILFPVLVVLGFKILDRVGVWLLLGSLLVVAFRVVKAAIARHRQGF